MVASSVSPGSAAAAGAGLAAPVARAVREVTASLVCASWVPAPVAPATSAAKTGRIIAAIMEEHNFQISLEADLMETFDCLS